MRQQGHRTILFAVRVAASLGAGACTAFLDAPSSTFREPPPFAFYLKADHPQAYAQFGNRVAVSGSAVAITAPFETLHGDPVVPDGVDSSSYVPNGEGSTYLFDLAEPSLPAAGLRIAAPNADPGDGTVDVANESLAAALELKTLASMNVAVSDDWLVVGVAGEDGGLQPGDDPAAAEADNSAESAGAVYVYSRSRLRSGDLTPNQYLKASNIGAGDYFGASVSLTDSQLIVGAPGEDGGNADDPQDESAATSGAAYVFTLQDEHFVFEQYLKPPAPIMHNQLFGLSMSVEADLLAIGAPSESSSTTAIGGKRDDSMLGDGAAYLYRRVDDRHWQFEEYVKPAKARPGTAFGWSVRVSSGRVAVGAPGATNCPDEPLGVEKRGAVYVFDRGAGAWAVDACLRPSVRRGDFFGGGLGAFGDTLLIGAPWDTSGRADDPSDSSQDFSGAVYSEQRSAGRWQHVYFKAPKFAVDDVFGASIDVGDRFAVVGAAQRSRTQSGQPDAAYEGAAYVFDVAPHAAAR